jgi:small Trp-rich protein
MYFLGLGLVLLALKFFELGPVALWPWWWVAVPFALAVAWWAWADSTGYTKRKAMEREDKRRDSRRERTKEALGMGSAKGRGR